MQTKNMKITMAYEGTNYHGYQKQKNNPLTIQQTVEQAIEKVFKHPFEIDGCSRTDAGVHAKEYVFSVRLPSSVPEQGIIRSLNDSLPPDIAIISAQQVGDDFHARFSSLGKQYEYLIYTAPKDPFLAARALRLWKCPDINIMQKAADMLIGEHDFKSFCSADCTLENTVRTIYNISVSQNGDIISIKVSGSGFLYNMVRIIVGTLIAVSDRKISAEEIGNILKKKDRTLAGMTVPACGLYLNKVFYSEKEVESIGKQ